MYLYRIYLYSMIKSIIYVHIARALLDFKSERPTLTLKANETYTKLVLHVGSMPIEVSLSIPAN